MSIKVDPASSMSGAVGAAIAQSACRGKAASTQTGRSKQRPYRFPASFSSPRWGSDESTLITESAGCTGFLPMTSATSAAIA